MSPTDKTLEYAIDGDVFANAVGIHKNKKRDVKALMQNFQSKTCTLEEPDGSWKIYVLCPNSEYNAKTNMIRLELNNRLREDFICLKENFTLYYLEDVLSLSGTYSVRIYEILLELRKYDTSCWDGYIKISDLRDMLLGEKSKKYSRVRDFIIKTINPSIEEINEKTQLSISFEIKKEGRGFHGVYFKIKERLFPKSKQPSLPLL